MTITDCIMSLSRCTKLTAPMTLNRVCECADGEAEGGVAASSDRIGAALTMVTGWCSGYPRERPRCCAAGLSSIATCQPRSTSAILSGRALGAMFWFNRNRFVRSYRDLTLTSCSHVSPGYAERIRAGPSSPKKPT